MEIHVPPVAYFFILSQFINAFKYTHLINLKLSFKSLTSIIYSNSADISKVYEKDEKDPEKLNNGDDGSDTEDNNGFAIVIHGHSLAHCLEPDLEGL